MTEEEGKSWLLGLLFDYDVLHVHSGAAEQLDSLGAAPAITMVAAAMFVRGGGHPNDHQAIREMARTLWSGGGVQWPAQQPQRK